MHPHTHPHPHTPNSMKNKFPLALSAEEVHPQKRLWHLMSISISVVQLSLNVGWKKYLINSYQIKLSQHAINLQWELLKVFKISCSSTMWDQKLPPLLRILYIVYNGWDPVLFLMHWMAILKAVPSINPIVCHLMGHAACPKIDCAIRVTKQMMDSPQNSTPVEELCQEHQKNPYQQEEGMMQFLVRVCEEETREDCLNG